MSKGFDLLDVFCGETKVARAAVGPGEGNRAQTMDDVEAPGERVHVGFVAELDERVATWSLKFATDMQHDVDRVLHVQISPAES